ncbi:MAG TPA: ferritin family protein [Mucilaginibacter sp.]|nr:ferritin family protein [Mucilaginibacter sp.]
MKNHTQAQSVRKQLELKSYEQFLLAKKQFAPFHLLIVVISLSFVSCGPNNHEPAKITFKDHMAAEKKTIENMKSAYAGEVNAAAKYQAFSLQADKEGYHHIAVLYKAVSASENIHATNHKAVIEDAGSSVPVTNPSFVVKTTKENLTDDIEGETEEAKTMYPEFLKTAETAENHIAFLSLTYAMKSEKKHKFFFEQALGDINSNTLNSLPWVYFVCPVCGNTYATAPKHCDFSLTEGSKFIKFE